MMGEPHVRRFVKDGVESALFMRGADTRTLTILFSTLKTAEGSYWFYKQTEKLKCSRLFVSDRGRRWFLGGVPGLGDSLEQTIAAIRSLCAEERIRKVICIGHSMGGYGAMVYGPVLGAAAILAFSPEARLFHPGSRSKRSCKWKGDPQVGYDRLATSLGGYSGDLSIIMGELDMFDQIGGSEASRLPSTRCSSSLYEVPWHAHNAPSGVKKAGVLGSCLERFVANGRLPKADCLRPVINRVVSYPEVLLQINACLRTADFSAFSALAQSLDGAISKRFLYLLNCQRLYGEKHFGECAALIRSGESGLLQVPTFQALLGSSLLRMGQHDLAFPFLESAVAEEPSLLGAAADLATLHLRRNEWSKAKEILELLRKKGCRGGAVTKPLIRALKMQSAEIGGVIKALEGELSRGKGAANKGVPRAKDRSEKVL